MPLDDPVTSAHSAPYFFRKFCVGRMEIRSFGTQYVPNTMKERDAMKTMTYCFAVTKSMARGR